MGDIGAALDAPDLALMARAIGTHAAVRVGRSVLRAARD